MFLHGRQLPAEIADHRQVEEAPLDPHPRVITLVEQQPLCGNVPRTSREISMAETCDTAGLRGDVGKYIDGTDDIDLNPESPSVQDIRPISGRVPAAEGWVNFCSE